MSGLQQVIIKDNGVLVQGLSNGLGIGSRLLGVFDTTTDPFTLLYEIDPLNLTAVTDNPIPTELCINDTLIVQNDDTTPTENVLLSAETAGVGSIFGISYNSNTDQDFVIQTTNDNTGGVLFKQIGIGSTTTQTKINQGVIVSRNTANSNAITINPSVPSLTITDGTNTNTITATGAGLSNTLQQVLDAGNSATGANANITLIDTDVGGGTNPILVLQNTNATGSVVQEVYKNKPTPALAGDILHSLLVYGKDGANTKQEYGRIVFSVRDNTTGTEDGSIDFGVQNAGVATTFLQINGIENEINALKNLDMGGNQIRTNTGDLTITTTTSTGTGNIAVSAKGFNNLGSSDSISLITSGSAGTGNINLTPRNNALVAVNGVMRQEWVSGSDTSTITYENDAPSLNSAINMNYQSPAGNMGTNIQNIPTIQRILQSDGVNNKGAEYSPTKIQLTGEGGARTLNLENTFNSTDNRMYLFNNQGGGIYTSSGIINGDTTAQMYLSYNNNANSKSTTITTSDNSTSSIVHNNTIDGNSFNIETNTDLNISSGDDININATGAGLGTRSVNITANGSGGINLTTLSSLTMNINNDLLLTGSSIINSSAGGNSGQHLRIFINGTPYKIALLND